MAQENAQTVDIHNGAEDNCTTKAVGFFSLKPQLVFQAPKAADAVQFYKLAFGAEELKRDMHPKRKADQELPLILSAELKLGSSIFIVCDQTDGSEALAKTNGSEGFSLCLETDNVDEAVAKAVNAGAVSVGEIVEGDDSCCGSRVGKVKDPYGYVWLFCSTAKPAVEEA